MSNYRRFITYLFWYENNDKRTNCGFAKVEQRQNEGQMELHIRNCPGRMESISVYFFAVEEDRLPMVLLGTVPLKKHMAEAVFKFDCEAVAESSFSLNEIHGIVIPLEEGLLIASLWDDEKYDWRKLYDTKKLKNEEAAATGEQKIFTQQEGTAQREEITDEKRDAVEIKDGEADTGKTKEEALKIQSAPAADPVSVRQDTWWQQMAALYPRMYPFSGDTSIWGMQIQLRDIRLLPQQYRILGNNSFLIHGYFNYGMILIGYMEQQEKWFLGVPGIFQNQERVLASLFGFPEFRTQQECVQKTGEFGYWYRFLDV